MLCGDAIERCNAGVILIILVLNTEIEPDILVVRMNDRNVAGDEYDACLGVVAGDRILRISKLPVDPRPDFLVEFRLGQPGLPGIGVANVVFRIEWQFAILCESVGRRCEQRAKKQMFQDKVLNW